MYMYMISLFMYMISYMYRTCLKNLSCGKWTSPFREVDVECVGTGECSSVVAHAEEASSMQRKDDMNSNVIEHI